MKREKRKRERNGIKKEEEKMPPAFFPTTYVPTCRHRQ
jgi:hypothetical protein